MTGAIPSRTPEWLRDSIIANGWDVRPVFASSGHMIAVRLLGVCPACAVTPWSVHEHDAPLPRSTAHIAVGSRRLRCTGYCAASGHQSGWKSNGKPRGVPYAEWAPLCGPRASVATPTVSFNEANSGAVRAVIDRAIQYATYEGGVVAVAAIGPCGTGKTRAIKERMIETGTGSLLSPRHSHAKEHADDYKVMGGRALRRLPGVINQLPRDRRERARAWQDAGWNANDLLRDSGLDAPSSARGEKAAPLFGVHDHGPLLLSGETDIEFSDPLVFDEATPHVRVARVPIEHYGFVAGLHFNEQLRACCEPRAGMAKVMLAVGTWLARERRKLTREQAQHRRYRHADYVTALDLHDAFVRATASERAAPLRAHVWKWRSELRVHAPSHPLPFPPGHAAMDGDLTPDQWIRGDYDQILEALFDELEDPMRDTLPRPHGVCFVVSGYGDRVKVEVHYREAWGASVSKEHSVLIADATAKALLPATKAAWPNHRVRVSELKVKPRNARATQHVWLKSSAYARRDLLTATGQVKRKRGVPALVRLLREVAGQIVDRLGAGKWLGIIAPKPVAILLRAAYRVARQRGSPRALERAQRLLASRDAGRLLTEITDLLASGNLRRLSIGWQGNVHGTNGFEKCDALLTFPYCPNIGAVSEDARVLGVDATEHIKGRRRAELEQEWGRLRSIRASKKKRKLLLHVDKRRPPGWRRMEAIAMPRGGRIPSAASADARRLASELAARLGAASAAFICWIAKNQEAFTARFAAVLPNAGDLAARATAASRLRPRALSRAVLDAIPVAATEPVPGPTRSMWTMREIRAGAARVLLARINGEPVEAPNKSAVERAAPACGASSPAQGDQHSLPRASRRAVATVAATADYAREIATDPRNATEIVPGGRLHDLAQPLRPAYERLQDRRHSRMTAEELKAAREPFVAFITRADELGLTGHAHLPVAKRYAELLRERRHRDDTERLLFGKKVPLTVNVAWVKARGELRATQPPAVANLILPATTA